MQGARSALNHRGDERGVGAVPCLHRRFVVFTVSGVHGRRRQGDGDANTGEGCAPSRYEHRCGHAENASGAAAADDDDDDDGGGSGKLSKSNNKKAAKALADAQQANRDAKKLKSQGGGVSGGGGGCGGARNGGHSSGGGGPNAPGVLAGRVKVESDFVTLTWPKGPGQQGRPATTRTSKAAAVKKELAAACVDAFEICVPFQFMYALPSNSWDDDKR